MKTTTTPPKVTTTTPSLDPRFSKCRDAKRKGYGPYRKGVDPEYWWYEDKDRDGVVCD